MSQGFTIYNLRFPRLITALLLFAASLHAASDKDMSGLIDKVNEVVSTNDIPPLAPPLPEIPPPPWEQFSWTLWILVPVALVIAALVILLCLRQRKPPALVAPAAQARVALAALQARPEDVATLSQISQALRRYLITAFWLRPEEMTTTEFCATLKAHAKVGPELAGILSEFLRSCDERRFAPAGSPVPLGAAGRALQLVDQAEARRAWLRTSNIAKPA